MIFENHKIYRDFLIYSDGRDLTSEFLRSQKFFTDEKADPKILFVGKSWFISVPGTFKLKNGESVKIIQKWDGKNPSIQ